MTYEEAMEKISSFRVFTHKPDLKYTRELLDRIGAPDKKLKFVHIAGTNGKGSTSALIAFTLAEAGYKTAMFVSPFITEFCERFQINGKIMDKEVLPRFVEKVLPYAQSMKIGGGTVNEFEFTLAVGMLWFMHENCDIVVLETGLGGRYDGTNAINCPLVSAITSISLDHTEILGDTLQKITYDKCGIIKNGGITATCQDQPEDCLDIIKNVAKEHKNQFYAASASDLELTSFTLDGTKFKYKDLMLSMRLLGKHQLKNAALALCVIERLREQGFEISDSALKAGFEKAFMPCRFEIVSRQPTVIIDGAHNPGGAAALSCALRDYTPDTPKIAIVGMLKDKDVLHSLQVLLPLFDTVITLAPNSPRAMSALELATIAEHFCPKVIPASDVYAAMHLAMTRAKNHDIVIFGSLYLAADFRQKFFSKKT